MDIVSPILDLTCRFCGCIRNHTNSISRLEDNLKSLRNEMEKLMEERNDVKTRVESAEICQQMKRTEQVNGWLRRVEQLEREVEVVLQQGDEEIQKKCLKVCPRNCVSSHKLGKKVSKKLQAVVDRMKEGNFSTVAVTLPRARAEEMPLDTTVGLDSNVDKVLSFLRDDGVGIIGIYGMGGVGKTTLLKKLNNELATQLISSGEFDELIWVVVSKDLNVERVQDKIGRKLEFKDDIWRDKSQEEKKADIFRVLQRKKFVLLLDDICDRLDLLEVGVPPPDSQNKAKVVFTTRSEEICGLMGVQRKIKVECLRCEDAWDLFQSKVGGETLNSDLEILDLAKVVCEKCAGLPLALITIGRTMACKKTPQEWNYAISMLKKSTFKVSGMGETVFHLLKFSYDNLSDETTRSCLYCSLYPEDLDFQILPIINMWMGEGFFDTCANIYESLSLGHDIIGSLKLACLLDNSEYDTDHFKMHHVIRDMALRILLESGKKYLVQADLNLTLAPAVSEWEEAEKVFLWHNSIKELGETPRCRSLLTLVLSFNALTTISDSFFQFMPALKVLDLSHNKNVTTLPTSFFILSSLQHLDLSFTGIRELPFAFKSLEKLKYLYLNSMDKLDNIPAQVISSLSILQRLEMRRSGVSDRIVEGSIFFGGNELLLDELECLNQLQYLSLTVKTKHALQRCSSSQKLQSCTFRLGIELCKDSSSLTLSSLQKNFQRLAWLEIRNCDDLEELSIDWMWKKRERTVPHSRSDGGSFRNLWHVRIKNCKVLKDLKWLIRVPNLKILVIHECKAMEEVITDISCNDANREVSVSIFSRLQRLTLYKLPELKSIYSHPLFFPNQN